MLPLTRQLGTRGKGQETRDAAAHAAARDATAGAVAGDKESPTTGVGLLGVILKGTPSSILNRDMHLLQRHTMLCERLSEICDSSLISMGA